MASAVSRWIESSDEPADFYALAGVARFHPQGRDVLQGLEARAAESQSFVGHWQKEVAARAAFIRGQIQEAKAVFSSTTARQGYDQRLYESLRQAFVAEFLRTGSGTTSEAVRRWLRLTQHVHAARIDDLAARLVRGAAGGAGSATAPLTSATIAAKEPPTEPIAVHPAAEAAPIADATAAPIPPTRTPPRPPVLPGQGEGPPDDYGLMWIIGSASITAIVSLLLLFLLFGHWFGSRRAGATTASVPPAAEPATPGTGSELPGPEPQRVTPPSKTSEPASVPATDPTVPDPPDSVPEKDPTLPSTPAAPAGNSPGQGTSTPPPMPVPVPMPMPMPPGPPPTIPPTGRQSLAFGRPVHSISWDSAGKNLAIGGEGGEIAIWDPEQAASSRLTDAFTACTALGYSPTGRSIAVATADGSVLVWNPAAVKLERTVRHADLTDAKAVGWLGGSGESLLLVGDGGGFLRVFSASSGNQQAVMDHAADAGGVQALAIAAKPKALFVSGHLDGTVIIWNGSNKSVEQCLAVPDASILAALEKAGGTTSKSAEVTYCGHDTCYGLSVSPDGKLLAIGARDLELWELDSPHYMVRRRLLPGADDSKAWRPVAFSRDGALLATGNAEGTLAILDVASWTVVAQEKLPGSILALDWHPVDRRHLAVGVSDGQVVVIPFTKDIEKQRAAPDFDARELIKTTKTLVTDENWYDCARLVNVLSAYQIPLTEKSELDRIRLSARKAMESLVNAIDPKATPPEELDDATANLQLAIDFEPTTQQPLGRKAREILKVLPIRTPASIAAAQAAPTPAQPGKKRRP